MSRRVFVPLALLMVLYFSVLTVKAAEVNIPQYLQDVSVTIKATGAEGSGTLITTKDGTTWVLTAGHVVAGLRKEREMVDSRTGGKRVVIEFDDAKIVKLLKEDNKIVGRIEIDAEVIRYSNAEHGDDIAILRVRKKDFSKSSATFYLGKEPPAIGSELYHCGSLLGQTGSNSLTSGIMSQHGRMLYNKVYDQTTCTAFPGSSGGIVCLKNDGRYVGMLVRGAGEGFNLIVPVRRLYDWAKNVGVDFVLDPSIDVPDEKTLKSFPVEDSFKSTDSKKSDKIEQAKDFPFMLYDNTAIDSFYKMIKK